MLSTKFIFIKEWLPSLHCLTSMSGHGANHIFFNKKIKIGRPEHLLFYDKKQSSLTKYYCIRSKLTVFKNFLRSPLITKFIIVESNTETYSLASRLISADFQ